MAPDCRSRCRGWRLGVSRATKGTQPGDRLSSESSHVSVAVPASAEVGPDKFMRLHSTKPDDHLCPSESRLGFHVASAYSPEVGGPTPGSSIAVVCDDDEQGTTRCNVHERSVPRTPCPTKRAVQSSSSVLRECSSVNRDYISAGHIVLMHALLHPIRHLGVVADTARRIWACSSTMTGLHTAPTTRCRVSVSTCLISLFHTRRTIVGVSVVTSS